VVAFAIGFTKCVLISSVNRIMLYQCRANKVPGRGESSGATSISGDHDEVKASMRGDVLSASAQASKYSYVIGLEARVRAVIVTIGGLAERVRKLFPDRRWLAVSQW
jgi:hypothetical protein